VTTCGIYIIRCAANNRAYVGQTGNISKRFCEHKRMLRTGKHHNAHLQAAWNKYGESQFTFTVGMRCGKADLTKYEQVVADRLRVRCVLFNQGEFTHSPMRGRPNPAASEHMRLRHKDPEFAARRNARAKINIHALRTPKAVAAFKAKMKSLYATPEYVAKRSAIMHNTLNKPGFVEAIAEKGSETMKKLWSDPSFVERTTERMKVQNKDPEFTKKRVAALSEKHKDPEFTKRRLALSLVKRAVAVVHIPTGAVYTSIVEAETVEPRSTIY
jgi:group I intron endonuclease